MRYLVFSLLFIASNAIASIRINGTTDAFTATTSLPTNTSFTMMGWFKLVNDRNTFSAFFRYGSGTNEKNLLTVADGTTLGTWDGTDLSSGTSLTVGQWYHLTMTYDDVNVRAYLNGVLDSTNANTTQPTTTIGIGVDTDSAEWINGRFACIKIFSAVLDANQILNEMNHCRPMNTQSLNRWLPETFNVLAADALDMSGRGANMTVAGTPVVESDHPPVSW